MFFSLRLPLYLPINHGISPRACGGVWMYSDLCEMIFCNSNFFLKSISAWLSCSISAKDACKWWPGTWGTCDQWVKAIRWSAGMRQRDWNASVWRLANSSLERPNNRGLCAGPNNRGLCAGKGQAATLEQQRLTARGLGGSGARDLEGFKSIRVLSIWSLANECPNGGF